MLCLGEVPFIAGKRIPALRSRLIGLILAGFLPLALGVRQGSSYFFPDEIEGQALTWSLFGFCWFAVCVLLFRVMVPKRAPRKPAKGAATPSKKNPFGAAPAADLEVRAEVEPAKKAPAKKKTPEPAPESLAWMEPDAQPEPVPKPAAKKEREPAKKATPAKKPAGKKAPKPPADDDNPFNFS